MVSTRDIRNVQETLRYRAQDMEKSRLGSPAWVASSGRLKQELVRAKGLVTARHDRVAPGVWARFLNTVTSTATRLTYESGLVAKGVKIRPAARSMVGPDSFGRETQMMKDSGDLGGVTGMYGPPGGLGDPPPAAGGGAAAQGSANFSQGAADMVFTEEEAAEDPAWLAVAGGDRYVPTPTVERQRIAALDAQARGVQWEAKAPRHESFWFRAWGWINPPAVAIYRRPWFLGSSAIFASALAYYGYQTLVEKKGEE